MIIARVLMFLLLGGAALSFALYALTGQVRYRRYGLVTLKWTLAAAFLFFAVLIAQRVL